MSLPDQLVFQIAVDILYTNIKLHKEKEWTASEARTTHNFRADDSFTSNFNLKITGVSTKVVRKYLREFTPDAVFISPKQ